MVHCSNCGREIDTKREWYRPEQTDVGAADFYCADCVTKFSKNLMEDKIMPDMDKGLYSKYIVTKADGTPLDGDCFVLRPDRDPAAVKALLAYAASTPNEELSSDIRIWLASIGADMGEPDEITALRAENEELKAENERMWYELYDRDRIAEEEFYNNAEM